jgi:hypothetical protein
MSKNIHLEIEPVTLTDINGTERRFLLTAGGFIRVRARLKVKNLSELLAAEDSTATMILYEALIDKSDLSEEQFAEILPYNPKRLGEAIALLLGAQLKG